MKARTHTTAKPVPQKSVEEYLAQERHQDLLRFITCGSVDDGKSTLIGRLLWESHQLFDDQLAALRADAKRRGRPGDEIDFAFALDGLAAEREQGITIDVAYRFFGTARRKFIVADTPGHEQYTRNMVTGASTAEVAVLLVDARKGLLTQTRRHAYLVRLMHVQHVLLAVNKMDLVAFDAQRFRQIEQDFVALAQEVGLQNVTAVPVSALLGDNLTERSAHTPWHSGPTLLGYLETVPITLPGNARFALPVQWVNRPNASFRGFSGTVAQGKICVGDPVRVTSSGQVSHVAEIVTMDGLLDVAESGQAITVKLSSEVDVSRGDVLSLAAAPIETTDQFEATLIWMDTEAGLVGRSYGIKLATQWANASITGIKYRTNIESLRREAATHLDLNDICTCNVALSRPLAFDTYENSKTLGGFILIDRTTQATVGAGLIRHNLRRAQNIHQQMLTTNREHREALNGHRGKVIWFTGLSGSGKSTIANALEVSLHRQGKRTYILDGDNIRRGLNKDLGFTDADRVENIRRITEVARLMLDAGLIVIVAFISPFLRERQMAREIIGAKDFIEVYVSTPLDVCEQRDVKGLYKKARKGLIPNMSGIHSPYEPPTAPDITLDCASVSIDDNVDLLMALIQKSNSIASIQPAG